MKISVITVNFNDRDGLEETVRSVAAQTYRDIEYIVIDGGSTDGSKEVIEKHSCNISYWVSERDKGIYNGMNKGIAAATGNYCIFMNSGDTFFDDNVISNVSEQLDADIVCGNAQIVKGGDYLWTAPEKIDLSWWLNRYSICHQSTFIRTEILKTRPYNENYKVVADYESFFYETIVNKRSYKKINLTVCNYGVDGISASHDKADDDKIRVIDTFRYNGLIEEDELLRLCKKLHYNGRRYKLALKLLKYLSDK